MKNGIRQPTPEELVIINQHYAKKDLKADDIYVFDLRAANNRTVTAYFSKLGDDMIEAFQENILRRHTDQNAPIVGYLFGHNKEMIPSGTVFNSKLDIQEPTKEGETKGLDFRPTVFMSKNLNVGGINTDDYVKAYENGHTEDVSVGFIAGSYLCDICNNDIRSWNCDHIPGRVYNLSQDAEKPLLRQATYTVHQGPMKKLNLAEISGVYRGAMWGAKVDNQLSVKEPKEGGKTDQPTIFLSRNIKDFKEGDILRFNCAGDGVIELVSRETDPSKKTGGDPGEELKKAQEEVSGLTAANKTQKENLLVTIGKVKELEASIKSVSGILALSEADKAGLQMKIDAGEEKIKKLELENKALKETNDQYLAELVARCEKLSIQVNGQAHNPDLFKKEVAALKPEEIRLKVAGLEEQVAALYPAGRKSVASILIHKGPSRGAEEPINPELYKIGR